MTRDPFAFFDTQAANWSDRYANDPRFARRFEKIRELLDRILPREPGRALDAGCGTGIFSRELARRGWHVTAIDASAEMIAAARAAREAASIEYAISPIESFVARASEEPQYDLILSLSTLEYIEDDLGTIKKLSNLLKPGGLLIVSVPNRKGLLRVFEGMVVGVRQVSRGKLFRDRGEYLAHQKHQYSPLELNLMMREAGLKKVRGTFLNAGFSSPRSLLPMFERRWWAAMYCGVYRKPVTNAGKSGTA